MDRESYEDPEVAAIVNDRFIAVKVDRDERPEVDRRYQTAVGAITGQGGWPLTAFLTEQGQVFYGGTYFPKNDMHGRPGYKSLLTRVSELYRDNKESALENARKIKEHLGKLTVQADDGHQLHASAIDSALETIGQGFDIVHGGFGRAPKFPHTSAIELALSRYYDTREDWLSVMINKTLEKMALGGVYDQLGGGFHRYSVDDKWIVPHFEKMSYDNSELLRNYVHGYQATGSALFREVAEGIVRWVAEVASDPERGGFYASQDADIDMDDDGDYFTWTLEEVQEALSPEDAPGHLPLLQRRSPRRNAPQPRQECSICRCPARLHSPPSGPGRRLRKRAYRQCQADTSSSSGRSGQLPTLTPRSTQAGTA